MEGLAGRATQAGQRVERVVDLHDRGALERDRAGHQRDARAPRTTASGT